MMNVSEWRRKATAKPQSVFSLGEDDLSDDEVLNMAPFEWLVYAYENGGYSGSGDAVVCLSPDHYVIENLSHCSCFGPVECFEDILVVDFASVLCRFLPRYSDGVLIEGNPAIFEKVCELCGINPKNPLQIDAKIS